MKTNLLINPFERIAGWQALWAGLAAMTLTALFCKSRYRVIDIAGTMALARAPMLPLALAAFLPIVPDERLEAGKTLVFALVCIGFSVWTIALMWKAFRVSTNIKGGRGAAIFIAILLLAEILSQNVYVWLGWKPSLGAIMERMSELLNNINL